MQRNLGANGPMEMICSIDLEIAYTFVLKSSIQNTFMLLTSYALGQVTYHLNLIFITYEDEM